jgi:hypothetical protein
MAVEEAGAVRGLPAEVRTHALEISTNPASSTTSWSPSSASRRRIVTP